jgi:hypothetical protein
MEATKSISCGLGTRGVAEVFAAAKRGAVDGRKRAEKREGRRGKERRGAKQRVEGLLDMWEDGICEGEESSDELNISGRQYTAVAPSHLASLPLRGICGRRSGQLGV